MITDVYQLAYNKVMGTETNFSTSKVNPLLYFKFFLILQDYLPLDVKEACPLDPLGEKIQAYYTEYRKTNPPKAKYHFQNHMYLRLKKICDEQGIQIEQEKTIDKFDFIYCDIILPETKTVIEVDGLQHFLYGNLQTAKDQFNKEVVKRLGYTIKTIVVEDFR